MTKTLDRYLFGRFVTTVLQIFVALFGMFVVIDGFTNFDNFQDTQKNASFLEFWSAFIGYYVRQSALIFHMSATTLGMLALLIVLAQLRRGELYPILSSGIPTRRLAAPLIWGVLVLNGVMAVNQEYVLPALADSLQVIHGQSAHTLQRVSPAYDHNRLHFDADEVCPAECEITNVAVTLPYPSVASEPVTLMSAKAKWTHSRGGHPSGWLFGPTTPPISQVMLTDLGATLIQERDEGLFVASDLTADQLRAGRQTSRFLSTRELADRVRHPLPGSANMSQQTYDLHARVTTPLINLGLVFVVMPLILRRDSWCLVSDIFTSVLLVATIGLTVVVGQFLASYDVIRPDLAAWFPLISMGITATLISPSLKT